MNYALSTLGQGSSSFITVPNWIRGALSSDTWVIGITFKLFDLSINNHVLGRSSSTAGSLRVLTGGELRYRDSSVDLITSAANLISVGTYYTVILRKLATPSSIIELWVGPENMDENLVGGTKIGETTNVASQILNPLNQIARFSTSTRNDIEVKRFWTIGGTYTGKADETTATGSGTSWTLANSGNALTLTGATGAADSWWVAYGGGGPITYVIEVAATNSIQNASAINVSAIQNSTVSSTESVENAAAVLIKTISFVIPTTTEEVTEASVVNINSIQQAELSNSQTVVESLNVAISALMQSAVIETEQLAQAAAVNIETEGGVITVTVNAAHQVSTTSEVSVSQTQVATVESTFTVQEVAIINAAQLQILSIVDTESVVQASPVTILDAGAVVISVVATDTKQEVPTIISITGLSNVDVISTQTNVNAYAPINVTQDVPEAVIISVVNTQAIQQAALVNVKSIQKIQVAATQTRTYGATIEEDTTKVIEYWRINVKLMQAPFVVKNSTIAYQALR